GEKSRSSPRCLQTNPERAGDSPSPSPSARPEIRQCPQNARRRARRALRLPGGGVVVWRSGPPAPKPGTLARFAVGLLGLAGYARRKKRARQARERDAAKRPGRMLPGPLCVHRAGLEATVSSPPGQRVAMAARADGGSTPVTPSLEASARPGVAGP